MKADELRRDLESAFHTMLGSAAIDGSACTVNLEYLNANAKFQAALSDLVRLAAAQPSADDAPRAVREAWPECSGDPASCPENEGYGCCKPNPGDARDGDTALLDWIESQYKSTSVQMSGIATYVATGQALRQLRGRSFRDAIRRAMGGE